MAEMTAALDVAHRRIRRIAADDGPYPGTLVADGQRVAVWVGVSSPPDVVDWRFLDCEHVAAPVEIARSRHGHGALLPWCTTRVSAFLSRRPRAGTPLEAGEWATLVVSVLRGLREIADRADAELTGSWWLSDDGRPLCVPGGDRTALSGAAEILQRAGADCVDRALRRLLRMIADTAEEAMPTASRVERWEREIFEFAAPRALSMQVDAAESGREPTATDVTWGAPRSVSRRVRDRRDVRSVLSEGLARMADAGRRAGAAVPIASWLRAGTSSRGRDQPERASRSRGVVAPHRRRGLFFAGVGVAAVVVAVGMLLPAQEGASPADGAEPARPESGGALDGPAAEARADDATSEGDGRDPRDAPGAEADERDVADDASPTVRSDEPSSAPHTDASADPVAAAEILLRTLDSCAESGDDRCPGVLAEGAGAVPTMVLRGSEAGSPVLVDDYGDLAVLRLGMEGKAEQMLVLIRQDGKWLVRDAYDVADQPG